MYKANFSNSDLSEQLLVGIKKHLMIAQNTSTKKQTRIQSLENVAEVIEYVLGNMNESIPEYEIAILSRFFIMLLVKIKKAIVSIHTDPDNFVEEIAFLSILLKM